jgi:SOS-response transcriptional repressor LexA
MPPQDLTKRQKEILTWFFRFLLAHGFQPSMEQMAHGLGMAGRTSAKHALNVLCKKGWVEIPYATAGQPRCIRPLYRPDGEPFAGLQFAPVSENPSREPEPASAKPDVQSHRRRTRSPARVPARPRHDDPDVSTRGEEGRQPPPGGAPDNPAIPGTDIF